MNEVGWPSDMECLAPEMYPSGDGWLTFIDPKGVRSSLPITTGPSREDPNVHAYWHIEVGDGWVETSPSIHVPGRYHSPGTVRWRVVEKLGDE